MKSQYHLYNISFPIWFILLIPYTWIVLLPVNFLLESLLLILALWSISYKEKKVLYKKIILKVWLLGLLADVIGYVILFIMLPVSSSNILKNTAVYGMIDKIAKGIMDFPYDNIYSTIWVILSFLVGVISAYYLHMKITFKKVDMNEKDKRKVVLILSILSGPFLGLLG